MADGPLTYKDAGVDRAAVASVLTAARAGIRNTFTPAVLGDVGQFSGLYHLSQFRDPVLVSTIDGVGTKTLLAREAGQLEVAGRDAIVHGVNDVAVLGATPLFALDYIAASRLDAAAVEALLEGMIAACREEGVALIGGETAQMPGVYTEGGQDVVACVVGVVEREEVCDGSRIKPGDVLIGLAASGPYTNGFTLIREIMARRRWSLDSVPESLGIPLRDALLIPHRSYRRPLLALAKAQWLRSAAHITGGGIPANLTRILPDGCRARVAPSRWATPRIFTVLAQVGKVDRKEMFDTFNMGIGVIAVGSLDRAGLAVDICRANGAEATIIGEVVLGERGVDFV